MGDKITELPWKVRSTLGHVSIYGADNEMLVGWSVYPEKPYVNNAQFIVKAVNNHDKLVEALRKINSDLRLGCNNDATFTAQEALNNLEGE